MNNNRTVFKAKVFTAGHITFDANDMAHAIHLITRYFSNLNPDDIHIESIVEIEREGVDPEQILDERHCPDIVYH